MTKFPIAFAHAHRGSLRHRVSHCLVLLRHSHEGLRPHDPGPPPHLLQNRRRHHLLRDRPGLSGATLGHRAHHRRLPPPFRQCRPRNLPCRHHDCLGPQSTGSQSPGSRRLRLLSFHRSRRAPHVWRKTQLMGTHRGLSCCLRRFRRSSDDHGSQKQARPLDWRRSSRRSPRYHGHRHPHGPGHLHPTIHRLGFRIPLPHRRVRDVHRRRGHDTEADQP